MGCRGTEDEMGSITRVSAVESEVGRVEQRLLRGSQDADEAQEGHEESFRRERRSNQKGRVEISCIQQIQRPSVMARNLKVGDSTGAAQPYDSTFPNMD